MTDELRDQIRRIDPMHSGVLTEAVTAPSSRELLEHIMSTPSIEEPRASARRRRVWYPVATGALAGLIAVGSFVLIGRDHAQPGPVALAPLELGLGDGPGSASCPMVSADILRGMPVAFEGVVATVEGESVTLDVSHWYAGGEATQVILHAPGGMVALTGGIDFQAGGRYLIAATDGVVDYCGNSGAYSAELAAIYAEAFGA
jgi:hypothetical protein